MRLCDNCNSITLNALTRDLSDNTAQSLDTQKGMVFLENGSTLHISALSCQLCALIQEGLARNSVGSQATGLTRPSSALSLDDSVICLEPKADPMGSTFPDVPTDGLYLTGFSVLATEASTKKQLRAKVRLFTEWPNRGSPHQHDVIGRPQFPDPSCDDAFTLMRQWLDACKSGHASCREALSGATVDEAHPPVLPTRVLRFDGKKIHLFQSRGRRGRYVTLSHCWGPSNRQPLRTTQDNLTNHLQEIPWSSITKTLQDAIKVAQKIGFEYIWIDSLCIVQDDQNDWLQESSQMGSIYERAEVTVAASHTSDSWEGFLVPRLPAAPSTELPNFFSTSAATLSPKVFATIRRDTAADTFPEFGALNYRAWATQEWLLSRRMIFFTKGVIIWSCKTITQRETGEKFYSVSRNAHWKNIVEQYSDRQLTFATDKMIALEGLRTEMGRKTGGEYVFGLWKESFPDQLLWQVMDKVVGDDFEDPLQLPTWTWTHVPRGVRFLSINGAKNQCESIEFSSGGRSLTIRTISRHISSVVPTLASDSEDTVTKMIYNDMKSSNAKKTSSIAHYILNQEGLAVGWVVWDHEAEDTTNNSISCLVLMSSVGRRIEEAERRTGTVTSTKLRHYWILVVRQNSDGTYTRKGVGKTYGLAWWRDAQVQNHTIT